MRDSATFFKHLEIVGWKPETVIDVGVANGTPALYQPFPDAYYILIDAVAEYEQTMQNLLGTLKGEYHLTAVSDAPGELEMMVQEPFYISSLTYDKNTLRQEKRRMVPVTTIDEIFAQAPRAEPVLLKTDCQGHDLQVIHGAVQSLPHIDVVICELPVYGPWGGGPEFLDYVVGMDELGYRFYDVWGWLYRPGDQRLQHLDLVFVRTDGPLRKQPLFTQGEQNIGFYARHLKQKNKQANDAE